MHTEFHSLAELCEELEATSKRSQMIDLVADFLTDLNSEEIEPATSMILGRAFPRWDRRTLEVSWAILSDVIKHLIQVDWKAFSQAYSETGDLGAAARIVFGESKIQRQATLFERSLTILEVRYTLDAIAETTGHRSREKKARLLETLLGKATPLETKYLVKILIGEMRTGFHEGLMELAVAQAFDIPYDTIRRASMITGAIEEVAQIAKAQGAGAVSTVQFQPFRPIKLMLAQTAASIQDATKQLDGEVAFEYKLDGARVQVHKVGDTVRIFSRRLTDVTESFPEIVQIVSAEIGAEETILEGEIIATGKDGNPLPFQHLMRRFRRVHNIREMITRIPVTLYLFDIIYLNGQSLVADRYVERRKKLREAAGNIRLTNQIVTKDVTKAEQFFREAIEKGHEGLIAKKLDSPYTPGARGKRWFKIKESLEPLDLVIVAAEYGYGRRHEWLSDYYLAARDPPSGEFMILGKTFKGLTDQEIIRMTARLKELTVNQERGKVIVTPDIVVEVAYNEIQKSPKYKSGMALRFARVTRIRGDKSPKEADTIQRVRKIYEKQFEKKAKHLSS